MKKNFFIYVRLLLYHWLFTGTHIAVSVEHNEGRLWCTHAVSAQHPIFKLKNEKRWIKSLAFLLYSGALLSISSQKCICRMDGPDSTLLTPEGKAPWVLAAPSAVSSWATAGQSTHCPVASRLAAWCSARCRWPAWRGLECSLQSAERKMNQEADNDFS